LKRDTPDLLISCLKVVMGSRSASSRHHSTASTHGSPNRSSGLGLLAAVVYPIIERMLRCGRVRVSAFAAALVVAASLPGVSAPAAVDLPEILVSRQLAEQAALREGDIATFAVDAAGTGATRVRVVGIYEPTPNPMRFTSKRLEARMHLTSMRSRQIHPSPGPRSRSAP
jgi:hypothetical protein